MRYLKYFEYKKLKFKVGDKVVLIKDNSDGPFMASGKNFKVGNIYTIIDIDYNDTEEYPYNLAVDNNDFRDTWVSEDQLRKAEEWELDRNKYNL